MGVSLSCRAIYGWYVGDGENLDIDYDLLENKGICTENPEDCDWIYDLNRKLKVLEVYTMYFYEYGFFYVKLKDIDNVDKYGGEPILASKLHHVEEFTTEFVHYFDMGVIKDELNVLSKVFGKDIIGEPEWFVAAEYF